jgi:hypothetical protein
LRTLSFGVPQTCQECLLAGVLSFAGELPLTAPGPSRLCRCCQIEGAVPQCQLAETLAGRVAPIGLSSSIEAAATEAQPRI